jgi:hypothetical protein
MVFRLAQTYQDPTSGPNAQRGFPTPGAGAQSVGPYTPPPEKTPWWPVMLAKGVRSMFNPGRGEDAQRGFAEPGDAAQGRMGWGAGPPIQTQPIPVTTPYYDRGAAAVVQNFGKILVNPIGAGIVALNRPQASYGGAAQYADGALWWTSQAIPTSINLQGLTDPNILNAQLGNVLVQAVVRTTG